MLYERQGRQAEQRRIGERLIGLGDPASRANGNMSISRAASFAGNNSEATRAADAAVAAAREAAEPVLLVEALCLQAVSHALAREFRPAERASDEATTIARDNNLRLELGFAHNAAGLVHRVRATQSLLSRESTARRAVSEYDSAVRIYRELNNSLYEAGALMDMSDVERIAGDFQSAEGHMRAALAILEPMGARGYIAQGYVGLGMILAKQERVEEARAAFQRGLADARAQRNDYFIAFAAANWGNEEMGWRNGPHACALLTEASNLMETGNFATGLDRFAVRMAKSAACSMR